MNFSEKPTGASLKSPVSEASPITNFIQKAAIHLLLASSPDQSNREGNETDSNSRASSEHEQLLMKPDFSISLDFLGPLVLYFLGIDASRGVILSDSKYAIACQLKGEALSAFIDYLEKHEVELKDMVGQKVLLNPSGERDLSDGGLQVQPDHQNEVLASGALKLSLAPRSPLTTLDYSPSEVPQPALAEPKKKQAHDFGMNLLLEISALKVLDPPEDPTARQSPTLKRFAVQQKPALIEEDQDVFALMQTKLAEHERFKIKCRIEKQRQQKKKLEGEKAKKSQGGMLDLSDLLALLDEESGFRNQEEVEAKISVEPQSEGNELRALLEANKKVIARLDQKAQEQENMRNNLPSATKRAEEAQSGRKAGLAALQRLQAKNQQRAACHGQLLKKNRRVFVNESTEITDGMLQSEKLSVVDLILQIFPKPTQSGASKELPGKEEAQEPSQQSIDLDMLDLENDSEEGEEKQSKPEAQLNIDALIKQAGIGEDAALLKAAHKYLEANKKEMTAPMFLKYIEFLKTHQVVLSDEAEDKIETCNHPEPVAPASGSGGVASKLALLARQRQARANQDPEKPSEGNPEAQSEQKPALSVGPQLTPEEKPSLVPGLGSKRTLADFEENQKELSSSQAKLREQPSISEPNAEEAEPEVRAMDAQVVDQLIDQPSAEKKAKPSKPAGKPVKKKKKIGFI